MHLKILATQWGSEALTARDFLDKVLEEGFDGVEINMPEDAVYRQQFMEKAEPLRHAGSFTFAGQCVLNLQPESFDDQYRRYKRRLSDLCSLQPDFVNCQTGKDFYTFDENCRLIELAMNISAKSNIPVYHETHRGKFSFHALTLLPYLEKFPEMNVTADFSHFCCVSESLLTGQEEMLVRIIPHVAHIHARIGFAQGPQVNDFTAPEWKETVHTFLGWWKQILDYHKTKQNFTILTEFGPDPYMPNMPFTQIPLTDQWQANADMKNLLKQQLTIN